MPSGRACGATRRRQRCSACPSWREGRSPSRTSTRRGDPAPPRLAEPIRIAGGSVRGSLTVYPGGVARNLEMAVVPLGGPEQPEGWVVALEDLTQLLRAQRQAARSEVARRIAHQIKNPLTPIRLAAGRLARPPGGGSPGPA